MSEIKIEWTGEVQFVASDEKGHSVVMDIPVEKGGGGTGFKPSDLLPIALGGCSAVDVVRILQKKKQDLKSMAVTVGWEQEKEFPQYFKKIHLSYRIVGKGIKKEAVERAIELSEEKYCSVGATLKPRAEISSSYVIGEAE
ncbi:MAG: OsmC family protein [Candidatus Zixiibacteriota bacterium]